MLGSTELLIITAEYGNPIHSHTQIHILLKQEAAFITHIKNTQFI